MTDFTMHFLMAAGALSAMTMPVMAWALVGYGATCRSLEQRNAAQAQTIAGLQARLSRRDGARELTEAEADAWLRTKPQYAAGIAGKMDGGA